MEIKELRMSVNYNYNSAVATVGALSSLSAVVSCAWMYMHECVYEHVYECVQCKKMPTVVCLVYTVLC